MRLLAILFLLCSTPALAKHTRLFACSLASDEPGSFMGGSSMGAGLWVSDDTGRSWSQLGWKHVKCYSVDVAKGGRIIYQACGNGVLKSTDAGATWKMMTDWRHAEVMDVAVDQKNPDKVIFASAHGLWRSIDGGESWIAVSDPKKPFFSTRVLIDRKDSRHIVAAANSGIYESHNGGESFQLTQAFKDTPEDVEQTKTGWKVWAEPAGRRKTGYKFEEPRSNKKWERFPHSNLSVGKYNFTGFLNHGVDKDFPSEGRGSSGFTTTSLEQLQIWQIKSMLVDD